ncbi:MAG: hypothetical protein AAB370_10305 [Verrucomicrobiota bacterium]
MRMIKINLFTLAWLGVTLNANSCDLCAVYRAEETKTEGGQGLIVSLAEQYIPYRTVQFEGNELQLANPDYVDSSVTHLVVGYDFSRRFGISLNVPFHHLKFRRTDLRYSLGAPAVLTTETGTESGVGDIALIGRMLLFERATTNSRLVANLLAGIKFPTGDTDRLADEVSQAEIYNTFVPPGTPHDPLGHSVTSVHQHSLTRGSGSFDGIFGITVNGRWKRGFLAGQFQYYLRTVGESDFQFGDEWIASGGPGVFLVSNSKMSFSAQANVIYDVMGRDEILGQRSDRTGMKALYLGPLLNLTVGQQFSANVGVDLPLRIENNGFQNVPDYRLQGGLSWRF